MTDGVESGREPMDRVRDEIAHLAVPIDSVTPHPRNPRRGDLDEIAASLEIHGQYKPILVQDSTGHILAGNHTWRAARERRGWSTIAVQRLDVDDEQAGRILAVDNATSDGATYDNEALLAFLDELAASEQGLAGTGYTSEALDDLRRMLEPPDLDELAEQLGEPREDDNWPTLTLRLPRHVLAAWRTHLDAHGGHEPRAFAALLGVDPDWGAPPPGTAETTAAA